MVVEAMATPAVEGINPDKILTEEMMTKTYAV